jgi:hypothetical protein
MQIEKQPKHLPDTANYQALTPMLRTWDLPGPGAGIMALDDDL